MSDERRRDLREESEIEDEKEMGMTEQFEKEINSDRQEQGK